MLNHALQVSAPATFAETSGPAARTAKQMAISAALATHPRADGESQNRYCYRIADVATVSHGAVLRALEMLKCEAIGAAVRAREAADAKDRLEVMPAGLGLGPVTNFRGWIDVFFKFKLLSEAYLNVAESRGDVYASAFLKDIRDSSDRAQSRAGRSKLG